MRAPATHFDATAPWRLDEQVSLRDESFGALAYHHGTRRLVFVKSVELAALIARLEQFESAQGALGALVPVAQHGRYVTALATLRDAQIIHER